MAASLFCRASIPAANHCCLARGPSPSHAAAHGWLREKLGLCLTAAPGPENPPQAMRRVKDLHAAGRPSDAKLIHILSSGIKVRGRAVP